MRKLLLIFIPLLFISCESKDSYALNTTDPYYLKLEKECNGSSCCRASLQGMFATHSKLADENSTCPTGYQSMMMKCITTYVWCLKDKK